MTDYTVARIVAVIAWSRITVFYNQFLIREKKVARARLMEFISKYSQLDTIKKCIRSVEEDIPKLFGFEKAAIMMHND